MTTHFRDGNLQTARTAIQADPALLERNHRLLARIAYLEGRYDDAIAQLDLARPWARYRPIRRYQLNQLLSLAYYQTDRYRKAAALPLRDHLTKLMRAFSGPPYRMECGESRTVSLPFLEQESWELPRVKVDVGGTEMVAIVDTGGDLFSIPWDVADELGIGPVSEMRGRFAGGRRARVGWARLEQLGLGDLELRDLPIAINSFPHPVVGTGLLRRFLTTIDYPGRCLILRPPNSAPPHGDRIPFLLAHTHLLIAQGELNDSGPVHFLIDSGLEADSDAALAAPEATLLRAGIPVPSKARIEGQSGAGKAKLAVGHFDIDRIALGRTVRHGLRGMTGVFPEQLSNSSAVGFPLAGLLSHNFLRHYCWTIDFARMEMTLGVSGGAS